MANEDDVGAAATQLGDPTQGSQPGVPAGAASGEFPASLIADRYQILALLGMGGMGRVYRAHDRTLDEVVALKILRRELLETPGVVERFRQEVKLARRVTSPHVVRTFDLGQHGADHYLTMEYVEGRSLAQVLDDGPPPISEVLRIARAACAGIAAAHHAAVLHRDLKPDNILVAKSGRIAITDFGIARFSASPTETGDRFVGTPAYMAPEQVSGTEAIGPPADVYAFGAILFEMLAGRRPFLGTDIIAVAVARLHEPPPDPRAHRPVPDALAELVLRCLAREQHARFPDAAALATALAGVAEVGARAVVAEAVPIVPAKTSRSLAVLPLRAPPDLADMADGLSEEIVDALSMTRALRVRPLSSVRSAVRTDADPRAIGEALGVDVVVDGSIRRSGDVVRISARAIGVADGFQLWANKFETRSDGLLTSIDEVAREVARALMVEIQMPARGTTDARATELYLEGKARLRNGWFSAQLLTRSVEDLEHAYGLAPANTHIVATLATAVARLAFMGGLGGLVRARALAEQAVALAPHEGDSWLALGVACLYAAAIPDAARAMRRAVTCAPGLATAQALLGALLLEAGLVEDAIAHLEGALALDPTSQSPGVDLTRAYVYAGRSDEAFAMLAAAPGSRVFAELATGRFEMWRGNRYTASVPVPSDLPSHVRRHCEIGFALCQTGTIDPAAIEDMIAGVDAASPRMKMSFAQFAAEYLMALGQPARALELVAKSVDSGLQDHLWCQRCPMLEPLRGSPRFIELAAIVAGRASDVLAAIAAP